jgi:hypothetical protein
MFIHGYFKREKLERNTDYQMTSRCDASSSEFSFRNSFAIRYSSFVIFSLLILVLATAMSQAQQVNVTGRWNIEIVFANGDHRSLHFDAQDEGKGFLELVDPRAKVWGAGTHFDAKWTPGEGNAVTVTGPVEFMLGNVGRDTGTLILKGKFEGADVINGDVEFAPRAGNRPSRHGTFKATRSK